MKTHGQAIRELRQQAGLSLAQFAEALGVSYQRAGDIERDRKPISLELILEIAGVLGCDPHAIDARLASTRGALPASKSNVR